MSSSAQQPIAPNTPDSSRTAGLILGIDPGLRRTGYALLRPSDGVKNCRVAEAGVVRLRPQLPLESRLVQLERALDELITSHSPTSLACEQLYAHYKHPRTAIIMAHARGVILALAARRGLDIINVGATHVKKHLTGNGRASKRQIQRAVATALQLPQIPEPNDVADAIAVALCGLRMLDAQRRTTQAAKGANP